MNCLAEIAESFCKSLNTLYAALKKIKNVVFAQKCFLIHYYALTNYASKIIRNLRTEHAYAIFVIAAKTAEIKTNIKY